MGILDEAIREHLELKRTHGAAEQDVQRLESEAFGPPTRPGDPDFPESDAEQAADESPRSDDETASADGEPEASTAVEEPATAEPLIEEPVAESQATEHPVVEEQPSDEVSLPASD